MKYGIEHMRFQKDPTILRLRKDQLAAIFWVKKELLRFRQDLKPGRKQIGWIPHSSRRRPTLILIYSSARIDQNTAGQADAVYSMITALERSGAFSVSL
jgi:hypothetical protein